LTRLRFASFDSSDFSQLLLSPEIERKRLLPPLMVVQILADKANPVKPLSVVKVFCPFLFSSSFVFLALSVSLVSE
jgi:hypothetical protein